MSYDVTSRVIILQLSEPADEEVLEWKMPHMLYMQCTIEEKVVERTTR